MKISEAWLRERVNPDLDTDGLAQQLTMAGLEVDGIEPACPRFEGLVVAEVLSVKKHPDADKLSICEVDNGQQTLTIVCGAPNVKAGMKTVLANVGAALPGIEKLKLSKLKGVVSDGMLCSASEIGLGEGAEGIIELPSTEKTGADIAELITAQDQVIEISLTPNRGDCLSIDGIAREVGVFNNLSVDEKSIELVKETSTVTRSVIVTEPEACPRYLGRIIENVDCSIATPLWMREKLRRSGVRSINIVVDITNLVMLELGQPMHAFDNNCLKGDICVRYARQDESIRLLDEDEYTLNDDTLVIADDSGAIAAAGIMGGLDSAVQPGSKDIFLESAFFSPSVIIGQARRYGLHTDSSHRFERGIDPELQAKAMDYASSLIIDYCGGEASQVVEISAEADIPKNQWVPLRASQVKKMLGVEIQPEFIERIFMQLGFDIKNDKEQWLVKAPSYRFDINIEADLIEELARIHGYDAIPSTYLNTRLKVQPQNSFQTNLTQLREILVNRDYQETISYSFVDPDIHNILKLNDKSMTLANPIAPELSTMRLSTWPGLLKSLQYNLKRQQSRVRLFESGLVFVGQEELKQEYRIGGIIYGNKYKKQWDINNSLCDIYDLKMDVDTILAAIIGTGAYQFEATNIEMLHPGQALSITGEAGVLGVLGQLHPAIKTTLSIPNDVYVFELYMEKLSGVRAIAYQAVSKYPAVSRDIAIVVGEDIALGDITESIKNTATNLLTNLELFDVYHGEGIEIGKKSLALGLTFQATSSTLKDEEIEAIMEKVVSGLNNKFGAKLRE